MDSTENKGVKAKKTKKQPGKQAAGKRSAGVGTPGEVVHIPVIPQGGNGAEQTAVPPPSVDPAAPRWREEPLGAELADNADEAVDPVPLPVVGAGHTGVLPYVSIIIPVYNEEGLLETSIRSLQQQIREVFAWPYEILIAENGSIDATLPIARRMAQKYSEVRVISMGEANYGKALKRGILESRGTYVICDEIDLCDVGFYQRALGKLELGYDLVVGSKLLESSDDRRPMFRHLASHSYNMLLRLVVGFKGTDTHGLKAFHRDNLLEVVADCMVDKDVFSSELVIRAERRQLRLKEIPLRVVEKRMPSINLVRRVPRVLRDLVRLAVVIRLRG